MNEPLSVEHNRSFLQRITAQLNDQQDLRGRSTFQIKLNRLCQSGPVSWFLVRQVAGESLHFTHVWQVKAFNKHRGVLWTRKTEMSRWGCETGLWVAESNITAALTLIYLAEQERRRDEGGSSHECRKTQIRLKKHFTEEHAITCSLSNRIMSFNIVVNALTDKITIIYFCFNHQRNVSQW